MLELKGVSAGYDGEMVISDISLGVSFGEKLAVIGPNGCGKTTLLRAVAGLLPYSGEITLEGRPLRGMKQREVAAKIAVLSQLSGMYFSYTVYDTVMMGRYAHFKERLLGLAGERDKERVRESLESVGMWNSRGREITELSGGQLQRVFLARTLAQEPRVLLLDEPTNHLDLKYQAEFVRRLRDYDCTVIGVFHDINLAMQLGGNVLLMKDGGIRALGKASEVVTGSLLQDVYEMDVAGYMRETLQFWERGK